MQNPHGFFKGEKKIKLKWTKPRRQKNNIKTKLGGGDNLKTKNMVQLYVRQFIVILKTMEKR